MAIPTGGHTERPNTEGNDNEVATFKLGNQRLREAGNTVCFDATHRRQRFMLGGEWGEYDVVKLAVPVSFLKTRSLIQQYDADADVLMAMYKQRINAATLEEIAGAKGHLHTPPLLTNMLEESLYRVMLLPGRTPGYLDSHCRVIFPADVEVPLMRTFDGGGRTSYLSGLWEDPDEVVDIVLSNMPKCLELVLMRQVNTHARPMKKSQAAKIEAEILRMPEGARLDASTGSLGMSGEEIRIIQSRSRASDVVSVIRRCGAGMPLYQMVRSTNDGKYVSPDNVTHAKKPKGSYVCRTIDDGVLEVLQTGREGRKSECQVQFYTPPSWWNSGVLAVEESAMYIQNIYRAVFSVWPQVKRAWEENEHEFVLTENRGVKSVLAFAWQVLKRVEVMVGDPDAGARLGVSFWTEMFDMMAPNLPMLEAPLVPLVDANHVEFWSKQAQRWSGKGSNTTVIQPVVSEMKEALNPVGGLVRAILQTSDIQSLAKKKGVMDVEAAEKLELA